MASEFTPWSEKREVRRNEIKDNFSVMEYKSRSFRNSASVRSLRDNVFLHHVDDFNGKFHLGFTFPHYRKKDEPSSARTIKINDVNHVNVILGQKWQLFGCGGILSGAMLRAFQILVVFGVLCAGSCESTEGDVKVRQGKIGLLSGATAMLGSLAQDLISRSAANSQVLSLNLTNLFILLVLKALIFGAGAFGYGHGGYGRNVDGQMKENLPTGVNFDEFLSESELLLMLSYLKADSTQKFGCLERVACEDPRRAKEYVFTGKLILKGSEIFTQSLAGSKYDNILGHLEDAISYGLKGQDCSARYQCEGS